MPNSSPICTDASLVVRLLSGVQDDAVNQLWSDWREQRRLLVAPLLLRYEVANALHRYRRAGELTGEEVGVRMRLAIDLPIRLHVEDDLHLDALQLADRFDLPAAYDTHYLALSVALDAELWTADRRLARAVGASFPWVHLVEA